MFPHASASSSRSPSNIPSTTSNPVHSFVVSSDLEGASPFARKDRSCPLFVLASLARMFIIVVSLSAITIAAISFASLLLSFVGATLLGLAKASGHLYADVTVISLVVATACGAAIIAAACAALVLVLMPLLICDYDVVVCSCCVVLSGGMITAFFAPAIGIAVTKGHVVGQSIELTAREAMKMNGVGLGGVLACGLALYMCTIGFMGALFSS